MIGYQARADKFGWFALTLVLMDACGAGLGVFVSCLFNDLSGGCGGAQGGGPTSMSRGKLLCSSVG